MDRLESWTLALTAVSVAEAEGFTETAKAFAEIAAMEMKAIAHFDALADAPCIQNTSPPAKSSEKEPIFRSVRLR